MNFQGYALKLKSRAETKHFPTRHHEIADTIIKTFPDITFKQAFFGIVRRIGCDATNEALKESKGKGVKYFFGCVRNSKREITIR